MKKRRGDSLLETRRPSSTNLRYIWANLRNCDTPTPILCVSTVALPKSSA